MKAIYLEPSDPEQFETVQKIFEKHEDFSEVRNDEHGYSCYNKKLKVCVVIDHPYSVCNPTEK